MFTCYINSDASTDGESKQIWSQIPINYLTEEFINLTKAHSPDVQNWSKEEDSAKWLWGFRGVTMCNHLDQWLAHKTQDTTENSV